MISRKNLRNVLNRTAQAVGNIEKRIQRFEQRSPSSP